MRRLLLPLLLAACSPGLPSPDSSPLSSPGPAVSSPSPEVRPPSAPQPSASAAVAPADAADAVGSQFTRRARQDEPQELLAPFVLNSQLPARKTLFSWTTKAQADNLRATKLLLSKTLLDAGRTSIFEDTLRNLTGHDTAQRLALFLRKPPMNRRRYAFSNALGWAVGVAGKPYGDVLLRVTLRDEAIVLGLGGAGEAGISPFRAMNLRGESVSELALTQHPERIAVVFHEGTDPNGISFREYVLVNEGMIESWAVGTDDILAELRKSHDALGRLLALSPESAGQEPVNLGSIWQGNPSDWPHAPWLSVLGTSAPLYAWTRGNLERIQQQLKPAVQPAALEHQPRKSGALSLPPLPPLPPPPPPPPPSKYKKRPIYLD